MSTHIMQLARDVSDEIVILKDGLLSEAEMGEAGEEEFEQRVMPVSHAISESIKATAHR